MNRMQGWARHAVPLSVAGVMLCGLGDVARADVKIVTEIETTGPPLSAFQHSRGGDAQGRTGGVDPADTPSPTPVTHTVTTYYKDGMARTETDDGRGTRYDASAKKATVINTQLKTYSILSFDALLKQEARAAPVPTGMHLDTQAELDVTGLTKTISGKDTRKYTFDGYMRTLAEPSTSYGGGGGGGGRRGGRRGGGGGGGAYPNGGNPGGGAPTGSGRAIPTVQVGGEYWFADPAILPTAGRSLVLPLLMPEFPAPPLLKPLHDRVAKLKLIPLYSQVTIREWGTDSTAPAQVTTTEVKSITEAPLDESLFKVPDGYQKVDPAAAARQNAQH